ncbi:hypothetical protein [Enterococcus larvae]|uniref:hypothetical protein n=1 Tax=Enterococcus larvae TaxID=2794352 RepID=UPI003F3ECF05
MGNPAQVTRKHIRFPAYDDQVGVKISTGSRRNLFQNEPLLTERGNITANGYQEFEPTNAPTPVATVAPTAPAAAPKTQTSTVDPKQTHTKEQVEELKRHKLNLPDYSNNHSRVIEPQKKPNLFGNMHKTSKESFDAASFGKRTTGRKITSFNDSKKTESYFVPTYVPASVIPDEVPEMAEISDQDLLTAMKKDSKSYLILDNEDVPFREKRTEDPSVQKFNVPNEEPDIPLTRRQYQKIRPNMQRFGGADTDAELPRSRTELKSAKNQTSYAQKVSEAENEQKKGIMDKSLSGIIEESSLEMDNSKYFN